MNLQNEYAMRHGFSPRMIAGHEGLLFLKDTNTGRVVAAHTGLRPKIHQLCAACQRSGMVVEVISFTERGCHVDAHWHIGPDEDLVYSICTNTGVRGYAPVSMRNSLEIETFVWRIYRDTSSLKSYAAWMDMLRRIHGMPNEEVQQMLFCVTNFSGHYQMYVTNLHYLVAGRKYLFNA